MAERYNKEIIELIKQGNERAFEALVKAEFNNIVFFVNQFVKDYMMADDIALETFISLWNSRDSLNSDANVRSYVFTIARNKALNLMREKIYSSSDSIEKREIQLQINALTSEYVNGSIDALDLEKLINKTYDKLPEKVRESFVMSRKFGLTYEQIAQIKGLNVKAVEYQISTALRIFRKKLKDYLDFY